jgi:type I restriction enzyme S subunit
MTDKIKQKNIPKGWSNHKISSVCEVVSGATPKTGVQDYWNGTLMWVTPKDLSRLTSRYIKDSERRISKLGFESCSAVKVPPYSLIMSSRAPIGYLAINTEETTTNQGCKTMIPKDNIFIDFLYYYLTYNIDDIKRLGTGSTFAEVSRSSIESVNILLPSLIEQRKISEILSSVDSEIQLVEAVISQAEKLKDGLMKDLLTKGINHTKFKKAEFGNIPTEWSVKKLEDAVFFENGKAHENFINDDGKFVVINSKFIAQDGNVFKKTNKGLKILNKGDIAIVMSDIPQGKALAKCFFVDEDNKYTLNQRIGLLRPLDGHSKYFFHVLNRNKYFLNFSNKTSQTNLRKQQVLDCKILIPPIEEQEKIVEILDAFDEKLSLNKKLKEKLIQIKKGLMSDLLTGKIKTIKN